MRKAILLVTAIVLAASVAFAQRQKANLAGSSHDFSGVGCPACHAPHNASQTSLVGLFWDRVLPTAANYDTYETSKAPTAGAGGTGAAGLVKPAASTDASLHSWTCLSCHDGTFAQANNATYAVTEDGPTDILTGTGMTDDHPVGIDYALWGAGPDTGYAATAAANTTHAKLFSNTLQCATCHDPHDPNTAAGSHFVRGDTVAQTCASCHT